MPPLAHETLDREGAALLREWIEHLPGPKVLPPPIFSLPGGKYDTPIKVCLVHAEPGTTVRYTTDGSTPTSADPVYAQPITLSESTTVRARAFKPGFNKSIVVQQTFVFARKP